MMRPSTYEVYEAVRKGLKAARKTAMTDEQGTTFKQDITRFFLRLVRPWTWVYKHEGSHLEFWWPTREKGKEEPWFRVQRYRTLVHDFMNIPTEFSRRAPQWAGRVMVILFILWVV